MIKHLLWIFLVTFLLSACEQPDPILPRTPSAILSPSPTPACYVVFDMTSTALYPVELMPNPSDYVYYAGQQVETAVTGGFTKWDKLQICGEERTYIDDFERTITILMADQQLVEFVCVEETCPVTFTIPHEMTSGSTKLVVQGDYGPAEYNILIRPPETPTP